jgi:HEAT repeat protein
MSPIRTAVLIAAAVIVTPKAPAQDMRPRSARLDELLKQLTDPDWDTRMEAATALGVLGPNAEAALPNLVEALKDPVPAVRMKAIDALMFMGTTAETAAPKIIPLLDDPDDLVRVSAVVALPRVTPDRLSTVPLLKKTLSDKSPRVRRQAAIELVNLRADVAAAIPVLRAALKDPTPLSRLEAIKTLAGVVSAEERKSLAAAAGELLNSANADLRLQTVRTLPSLGAEGVPYLVSVLKKEDEARRIHMSAVHALGRIGPDARAALPLLQELAQRKGAWLKVTEQSIAAIEGKEPPLPAEIIGPIPPLRQIEGESAAKPGTPSPSPSAPPR